MSCPSARYNGHEDCSLVSDHYSRLAHTPYDGSEPLFRIGLRPFDISDWLHVDHTHAYFLEEKKRLMAEIPEKVFQAGVNTLEAQQEVLEMVSAFPGIIRQGIRSR